MFYSDMRFTLSIKHNSICGVINMSKKLIGVFCSLLLTVGLCSVANADDKAKDAQPAPAVAEQTAPAADATATDTTKEVTKTKVKHHKMKAKKHHAKKAKMDKDAA